MEEYKIRRHPQKIPYKIKNQIRSFIPYGGTFNSFVTYAIWAYVICQATGGLDTKSKNETISQSLTVDGDTTLNSDLSAKKVITGDGSVDAVIQSKDSTNLLLQTGDSDTSSIELQSGVDGDIYIKPNGNGGIYIESNEYHKEISTNITGSLNVTGATSFNGNVTLGTSSTDEITINGKLGGTFDIDLADDITATSLTLDPSNVTGCALKITNSVTGGQTSGSLVSVTGVDGQNAIEIVKGRLVCGSTTVSTSTNTGAVTISGGLGLSGALYTGGITNITNSTSSSNKSDGALVVTGGVGISGTLNVCGTTTTPALKVDSSDNTVSIGTLCISESLSIASSKSLAMAGDSILDFSSSSNCYGYIKTNTSKGLKIGTSSSEKIGFFGQTPVIQQQYSSYSPNTPSANYRSEDSTTTLTAVSTSTSFNGGIGNCYYTLDDIVLSLKTLGFLKS